MRLRQVALVAQDLESVTARLETMLSIDSAYPDPGIIGFGLANWVAAIGDTFLEVVSPVREDTTAGRYLERRGGDGGYMVILQVDDQESARERAESVGVRIVWHAEGDGDGGERTEGLHLHPRDCGGAILSLDQATPPEAWVWAGPEWREHGSRTLSGISGVEIQADDPEAMAARWSEILGVEALVGRSPDGREGLTIDLGGDPPGPAGGILRFVPAVDGRGEGVCGLDVEVSSEEGLQQALRAAGASLEAGDGARFLDEAGIRIYFRS